MAFHSTAKKNFASPVTEGLCHSLIGEGTDFAHSRIYNMTRVEINTNCSGNSEHLTQIPDEQHQRLDVKLRRELGGQVLALLGDERTEDIVLNPDSSLWAKRMGEGFVRFGAMVPP